MSVTVGIGNNYISISSVSSMPKKAMILGEQHSERREAWDEAKVKSK